MLMCCYWRCCLFAVGLLLLMMMCSVELFVGVDRQRRSTTAVHCHNSSMYNDMGADYYDYDYYYTCAYSLLSMLLCCLCRQRRACSNKMVMMMNKATMLPPFAAMIYCG